MTDNDKIRDYLRQWAEDQDAPVEEVNDAMKICVFGHVDRALQMQVAKVALYVRSVQYAD